MPPLAALYVRELRLAVRIGGGAMMGVLFYLIVVTTFPFAIGPDLNLLSRLGPAILWIGALLATLLGLDRLFEADRDDGALDLLVASGRPLELLVIVKVAAHWTATGLPLIIAAPFLSLLLAMPVDVTLATLATLVAGTPALTLLGAIGAGLTVSLRRGGLLLPILVLPFAVPVLIFGVAAATAVAFDPAAFRTPFLLIVALTLMAAAISPIATAAALRNGLD
ncbi:heme exporter subunit; membrane component of ABC superfamily [uncultured Pleomorphomonas sp.]|uniref:Heme exporter protein B n=2 Tax=Pleomorphomonas TaxID=261933 RepID=A0A2G9WUG9_9HYPH|nr:heme exporter protein CcmB [Pleomorphomonas carboxyditropha]PIO98356.1 heme exporter protein CcmB [Pleomorphomonas carboxyditropha]SCM78110.1 heme exporter subunit; membrane component of ABC superfamily [uncultured Pleomorphomonas sp.]